MVRLHDDIDGCGCLRCQEVDYRVSQRSLVGALSWSARLPLERPSILLVLGVVGLIQLTALRTPQRLSTVLIVVAVIGVFAGRGYIGVVGRDSLGRETESALTALWVVVRRLPAFCGAILALLSGLFAIGYVVSTVVPPTVERFAALATMDPLLADFVTLLVLIGVVLYTLLRCWFVPEACFIGGYGPLSSIRVSWEITSVQTAKAALIVAGFGLLLVIGIALDTQLAGSSAPVALSFEIGETEIVFRSFGLSISSGFRFVFDLVVTALYSGVFVHQYIDSTVSVSSR